MTHAGDAWPRARRLGLWGAAAVIALGVSGCATYSQSFRPIERDLVAHQPASALRLLEKQHYPQRNKVLYYLNKGMLLRMSGDYRASNAAFESAKHLMHDLYTISVHQQAESLIINDSTRSYAGEEFEQVLVHLYEALNYIDLGQLDEARVEAAQVDLKLRMLTQRAPLSGYTDDAFAQYLSGMIYEALDEWSDAMISYRHAYHAYLKYQQNFGVPIPPPLKSDLMRMAQHLGMDSELERYEQEFGTDHWVGFNELRKQGELIFILSDGLVPMKQQHSVVVSDPHSGRLIRISLPYYPRRPEAIDHAQIEVGGDAVTTVMAENIGAIARRTLEDKMPLITARAIARAVLKYKAANEAGDRDQLAGLLVNLAGVLTEIADTRGWYTLPNDIQIARIPLAPGTYSVKVDIVDSYGEVVGTHEFQNVAVQAGRKNFLSYYWISPQALTGRDR